MASELIRSHLSHFVLPDYLLTQFTHNLPIQKAILLVEAGESRTPRPKEATQNILQA